VPSLEVVDDITDLAHIRKFESAGLTKAMVDDQVEELLVKPDAAAELQTESPEE